MVFPKNLWGARGVLGRTNFCIAKNGMRDFVEFV